VKNQVYQKNMQKIILSIFLPVKATILDTRGGMAPENIKNKQYLLHIRVSFIYWTANQAQLTNPWYLNQF